MAGKREEYLSWDEYFMGVSALSGLRGLKDNVGACIVDNDNRIVSVGFNRYPCNSIRHTFTNSALSDALYNNYLGSRDNFKGSTLYLSHFPNDEESRQIVQAKISKVFYLFKDIPEDIEEVSRKILGNVEPIPYHDEFYPIEEYINFLKEFKNVIKSNIGKKGDKLIGDEYYMGITGLSACRSKDPSTQVGSCLVDQKDRILSIGYNGTPYGMSDEDLPWDSLGELTGDLLTTKDPYIIHGEINAFDNYRGEQRDLKNAKIYLMYSPCVLCSERLSTAGLKKVIYLREYTKNNTSKISKIRLRSSRTKSEPYYKDKDIDKDGCIKFLGETQNVIKKHLTR